MVMMYAPHLLYVLREPSLEKDEFGRTVRTSSSEWVCVGECRCDDSSISEMKSDNGEVYRPSFHIVCGGGCGIKPGDRVEARWKSGEKRGEGVVKNVVGCNILDYKSVYL